MKILHTSDWHLGHTLNGFDRANEHARFLGWLIERLEEEQVDALLIAGDIFDQANPSSIAQQQYYDFLDAAAARCPGLQIVVVGGNHDSAGRLDAPASFLRRRKVHVVGAITRQADGSIDASRLLVELLDRAGRRGAIVAAVPFLRRCDLPPECGDDHVAATKSVYGEICAAAKARLGKGEALIATGHLYMVGGQVSEDSERKVQVGNQQAVPVGLFGKELAYVALGHLHLAQAVGGRENVRYSGSPLPLSMAEQGYQHEVRLLTIDKGRVKEQRALAVPRVVELLQLKATSKKELEQHLARFSAATPVVERPFVEVTFEREGAQPSLRAEVLKLVEGRGVRLVSLRMPVKGDGATLADALGGQGLSDLQPENVFSSMFEREFKRPPGAALLAVFHQLLEDAQ